MKRPANVIIKRLGLVEYAPTWQNMQSFTDRRDEQTADEIWFLQHPPVYTLGLNGNPEHLLAPADIPVINIDRGGQVTYHGPGQLVVYPLINLRNQQLGVRELVSALEQSVIDLVAGRLDAVLGDSLALQPFLDSAAGKCCEIKGELKDVAVFGPGVGGGMRKSDTALRAKFNAAIEKIRADGTYDAISKKYFDFDIYGAS